MLKERSLVLVTTVLWLRTRPVRVKLRGQNGGQFFILILSQIKPP